jgi:hypothetical protein
VNDQSKKMGTSALADGPVIQGAMAPPKNGMTATK